MRKLGYGIFLALLLTNIWTLGNLINLYVTFPHLRNRITETCINKMYKHMKTALITHTSIFNITVFYQCPEHCKIDG